MEKSCYHIYLQNKLPLARIMNLRGEHIGTAEQAILGLTVMIVERTRLNVETGILILKSGPATGLSTGIRGQRVGRKGDSWTTVLKVGRIISMGSLVHNIKFQKSKSTARIFKTRMMLLKLEGKMMTV